MADADPDLSISIEDGAEAEWMAKGSRFVGQAFRADDETSGQARLQGVRRRYHDATHHCWAARTGSPDHFLERWDDDGEPSGTAGVPIIGEIRHGGLHAVLVVVTRWFGGTKLGTGGLVRAYAKAAQLALEEAPRREVWSVATVEVQVSFDHLGTVEALLARQGSIIRSVSRSFDEGPRFRVEVRRSWAGTMRADLVEATRGQARISVEE